MATDNELEGKLFQEIRQEAKRRGVDPDLVKKDEVEVRRENRNIHLKWKDVEVTVPGPSQDTFDNWFDRNGPLIAGSMLTLAGVVVGGIVSVALATALKD